MIGILSPEAYTYILYISQKDVLKYEKEVKVK